MKIIICCEHYAPSVGGVQKVMQVLAEYFVKNSHQVTIACSYCEDRTFKELNGVNIIGFKVSGNAVNGMQGEIKEYQNFLLNSDFDCLITMAAQQWTCDALLPILNKIKYKTIQIPCGYSGFYQKKYQQYYKKMRTYLKQFDHLVYNAEDYRDINFAKEVGVKNIHHIPVGAGRDEFQNDPNRNVRKTLGIHENINIFLSVGSPPYNKGHGDVLKAYVKAKINEPSVLILNGDYSINRSGLKNKIKEFIYFILGRSNKNIIYKGKLLSNDKNKSVMFTNLSREEVVSLYFESDLFLFASHIEYSPLVIFECLAAGLPFLTVPVGNLEEVVEWTQGGILSHAEKNREGFTRADIDDMATKIKELIENKELLKELGVNGRRSWEKSFTWDIMSQNIMEIVVGDNQSSSI